MQCAFFNAMLLQATPIFSSLQALTSAEASHTHVVRGYHLLLDREVVPLQRVEGRVP